MTELLTTEGLISLLTLSLMEIILGIDNIIFISIVSTKLEAHLQDKARNLGLTIATIIRILLLFGIAWIIGLTEPLISMPFLNSWFGIDPDLSGKDLILLAGGLFLIAKSTSEIHEKVEAKEEKHEQTEKSKKNKLSFSNAVLQITVINIVFSFDSILTAIGLVKNVYIMMGAIIISIVLMMLFSKAISDFVEKHPTVKMLALAFLVMIGFLLAIEAFGEHVPKGYVYFAMAFSFTVELLNMRMRKNLATLGKP
ncbi:MAG: TerC family protein [Flammeovirgaceae bacterium]|nr:TerC family protein [Flammeovirgaceae bacterium]